MNGNKGNGSISIEARIKLVEQVHLKAEFGQLLHDKRSDLEIDIRLGQRDIAIGIGADRA